MRIKCYALREQLNGPRKEEFLGEHEVPPSDFPGPFVRKMYAEIIFGDTPIRYYPQGEFLGGSFVVGKQE